MYDYLVPLGVTSMMDVPIRLHGKLLGLICCGHVGPPREWSLEEQDFAASIADMIALQLETGERRRVERALAKANEHLADTVRELRRSNKELQDFTSVAAHDLKAPLRAIGTLADWIMSDYGEMFDEQGREQLRLLKARVSRMNELLDSVLHYSKIGRVSAQLEKIDLNEVISETIERVDPPEHIQFAIDENMPPVVFEKDHLCQVFLQLVSNAVRYMDKPQGRIEIRCTEEGRFWKITVADNGPGIEEKYFEKIFQMFQTLTPRDECESTGIGLAIAKKIVELHGGTIGVESRLGEGTTFFFTLLKQDESVIAKRIHAHVAK
jgi:light-regulated signal transduction histidine kinase (bacteriophytochrome)